MVKVYDVVVDTDDVEEMLTRVVNWLDDSNLDPFVRDEFGEIMRDEASERFQTESNNGVSWEPLKPSTVLRRVETGFPGAHPINVRTGKMQSFLIHSVPDRQAGVDIEYSWPERATGDLYMKLLRAAGYDTRVSARPVIDADETDMEKFIERAYDDLERVMR